MKKQQITILTVLLIPIVAMGAIIFYTDKPNAVPVGTDFMPFQRNNDYINASVNQFSNMLFTAPNFTGNGAISGNWTVGGIISGNGSGLFGFPGSGFYVINFNGFGTNETFWGPTTFMGTNQYCKLEIFDAGGNYVAGFDTNKGGFFGFGNLNGWTNLPNSGLQNSTIAFMDGAGIGGSGSPTALGGTYTVSAVTAAPQFAGIKLTGLSSAPVMQLNTNVIASATNTLDWTKTKYTFVSPTAMQTTGFVNFPTTNDGDILVHLVNNSGSSNWFYTWPMSIMMDGARGGVWVTNAQHRFIWFIYDPGTGTTNEIDAPNF